MEDVRIGRALSPSVNKNAILTAAAQQFCGQNALRTRLIFTSDGTGTVRLIPGTNLASGLTAWFLTTSRPSVVLRVEDWGKLVTGAWSVSVPVGPTEVTVTEVSLEKV